jgi:NaMN:DMB phosphoribosyltransferase
VRVLALVGGFCWAAIAGVCYVAKQQELALLFALLGGYLIVSAVEAPSHD